MNGITSHPGTLFPNLPLLREVTDVYHENCIFQFLKKTPSVWTDWCDNRGEQGEEEWPVIVKTKEQEI